jgi:hypothetical protein
VLASELPDALIRRTADAELSDVERIGKDVAQQHDQLFGQLFIEEQAHSSRGGNRRRSALTFRSGREAGAHILSRQLPKIDRLRSVGDCGRAF